QERAFAESPPCVLDHLPGNNPLKDRIATDRPPLLIVEAVRRPIVGGASITLRSRARLAGPRVPPPPPAPPPGAPPGRPPPAPGPSPGGPGPPRGRGPPRGGGGWGLNPPPPAS